MKLKQGTEKSTETATCRVRQIAKSLLVLVITKKSKKAKQLQYK